MSVQQGAAAFATTIVAALFMTAPAIGADANAGKTVFRTQCALCHSAEPSDDGGAQGPGLQGVFGRQAAGNPAFSYTDALRSSHLVWDAPTLNRFLASPTTVVPGSAMVIAVPNREERENLVAYFQALKDGTFRDGPRPNTGPPPIAPADANAAPAKGSSDWKNDKPGRVHRIDAAKLPVPFDSPTARNPSRVVDKPADAKLVVPAGFKVDIFASGLKGPRMMNLAPNGDIFVAETQAGRISVLRPSADGSKVAATTVFAQGLVQPFGMQFYPAGAQPRWLYVAENNRIVRYAYKVGDDKASGVPEVVVPVLTKVSTGHFTRDIAFSPDGKRMFVSIGSQSNVAEDMPKKSAAEIAAWEKQHAIGASWANEENRAAVLVFDVGTNMPGKIFATGIRNCVDLTVQPATGDLWCTTNERDLLGDDLVPDYSTRVRQGGFYGWPWYYMGKYEDPRHAGERPDLAGKAIVPDVLYQAHSAALNLAFYTATSGASAFPKEYVGDGFAVLHGSWNRAFRTGHKVVRVKMKNNVPTGEYEDFLVGFIIDDGTAWGRPVGAVVAKDGSLLVSDDGSNNIYRVSHPQ